MISRAQLESYGLTLDELSTAALGDLRALLDGLGDIEPEAVKGVLFQVVPELFDPYALAASNVSATFYEEVRSASGAPSKFTPRVLADPVPMESWKALVGAGTASEKFKVAGANAAFDALSGGLVKRLTEVAADTTISNAAIDPDPVSYQRVPSAGCCSFCGMLASRGAAYGSKESAGMVVGRGVPVEKTKGKRGGQGRGIKTRGKRAPGESFHDNCRCKVVAVHAGNSVEMQADVDKYYDAYRDAADEVNKGLELESETFKSADGSLTNRYRWVDRDGKAWGPKERTRAIAKAMDKDPGVQDAIAAQALPDRPAAHPELLAKATPKPSAGPTLSYESVKDLSDDELMEAMGSVFAEDPEAWDKLEGIMERRDADRLGIVAETTPEPFVDPFGTTMDGGKKSGSFVDPFGTVLNGAASPVTNPALRPARKLTPNERAAEEYWDYAQNQYQTALEDLNGVLFNKKQLAAAREKGITEDQLFTGPFHVANKYASDELREWWRANGRETQTSYRYQALGRPSDYKAWLAVQKQGLHASGISAQRREDRRGL